MSRILEIADAVVAELADGSFSATFVPQRQVLPAKELSDLADLQVTVVPKAVEISGASRSVSQYDVQIDIGIQKRLSGDPDTEVPGLLDVVDEIAAHLRGRPLADAPQAVWVRTANEPVYAPEHLAEQRTFTSVLTLTYRVLQ